MSGTLKRTLLAIFTLLPLVSLAAGDGWPGPGWNTNTTPTYLKPRYTSDATNWFSVTCTARRVELRTLQVMTPSSEQIPVLSDYENDINNSLCATEYRYPGDQLPHLPIGSYTGSTRTVTNEWYEDILPDHDVDYEGELVGYLSDTCYKWVNTSAVQRVCENVLYPLGYESGISMDLIYTWTVQVVRTQFQLQVSDVWGWDSYHAMRERWMSLGYWTNVVWVTTNASVVVTNTVDYFSNNPTGHYSCAVDDYCTENQCVTYGNQLSTRLRPRFFRDARTNLLNVKSWVYGVKGSFVNFHLTDASPAEDGLFLDWWNTASQWTWGDAECDGTNEWYLTRPTTFPMVTLSSLCHNVTGFPYDLQTVTNVAGASEYPGYMVGVTTQQWVSAGTPVTQQVYQNTWFDYTPGRNLGNVFGEGQGHVVTMRWSQSAFPAAGGISTQTFVTGGVCDSNYYRLVREAVTNTSGSVTQSINRLYAWQAGWTTLIESATFVNNTIVTNTAVGTNWCIAQGFNETNYTYWLVPAIMDELVWTAPGIDYRGERTSVATNQVSSCIDYRGTNIQVFICSNDIPAYPINCTGYWFACDTTMDCLSDACALPSVLTTANATTNTSTQPRFTGGWWWNCTKGHEEGFIQCISLVYLPDYLYPSERRAYVDADYMLSSWSNVVAVDTGRIYHSWATNYAKRVNTYCITNPASGCTQYIFDNSAPSIDTCYTGHGWNDPCCQFGETEEDNCELAGDDQAPMCLLGIGVTSDETESVTNRCENNRCFYDPDAILFSNVLLVAGTKSNVMPFAATIPDICASKFSTCLWWVVNEVGVVPGACGDGFESVTEYDITVAATDCFQYVDFDAPILLPSVIKWNVTNGFDYVWTNRIK